MFLAEGEGGEMRFRWLDTGFGETVCENGSTVFTPALHVNTINGSSINRTDDDLYGSVVDRLCFINGQMEATDPGPLMHYFTFFIFVCPPFRTSSPARDTSLAATVKSWRRRFQSRSSKSPLNSGYFPPSPQSRLSRVLRFHLPATSSNFRRNRLPTIPAPIVYRSHAAR